MSAITFVNSSKPLKNGEKVKLLNQRKTSNKNNKKQHSVLY